MLFERKTFSNFEELDGMYFTQVSMCNRRLKDQNIVDQSNWTTEKLILQGKSWNIIEGTYNYVEQLLKVSISKEGREWESNLIQAKIHYTW